MPESKTGCGFPAMGPPLPARFTRRLHCVASIALTLALAACVSRTPSPEEEAKRWRELLPPVAQLREQGKLDSPHAVVRRYVENENKGELLYIGALPVNDPGHAQNALIEERFRTFKPTLTFFAGGDRAVAASRQQTIREHGESGLTRFLAQHEGIRSVSSDAPLSGEVQALQPAFGAEHIKAYLLLRQFAAYRDARPAEPLDKYLQRFLDQLNALPALAGKPATLAELDDSVERLYEIRLWRTLTTEQLHKEILAPIDASRATTLSPKRRELGALAAASYDYRDLKMLRDLVDSVRKGERVLAVANPVHVLRQDAVLRQVFKELDR